jgi:hypothetical protein
MGKDQTREHKAHLDLKLGHYVTLKINLYMFLQVCIVYENIQSSPGQTH